MNIGIEIPASVFTVIVICIERSISVQRTFTIFQNNKSSCLSQSYHRYALNYINALNYLETLRRHNDFCEFEKVGRYLGRTVSDLLCKLVRLIESFPFNTLNIECVILLRSSREGIYSLNF